MTGLDLHGIVASAIGAVNPHRTIILRRYKGMISHPGGDRSPDYEAAVAVRAQIQPLPADRLQYVDRAQQGGIYRQIYLAGDWSGLSRAQDQGGDLVYFDGYEWIINPVQEAWGRLVGWTMIVVQAQRKADPPEIAP